MPANTPAPRTLAECAIEKYTAKSAPDEIPETEVPAEAPALGRGFIADCAINSDRNSFVPATRSLQRRNVKSCSPCALLELLFLLPCLSFVSSEPSCTEEEKRLR